MAVRALSNAGASAAWLRTNGVTANGVTAKIIFSDGFEKYSKSNESCIKLTDIDGTVREFDGNTQMYLLSKTMKFAMTELALTPLVRCWVRA